MKTEYGRWSFGTSIHAVGYDGVWLCGRSGKTSSECGESLDWVDCKRCLKNLHDYLLKFYVRYSLLEDLEKALKSAKEMSKKGRGNKDTLCAVNGLNESASGYIDTWIIPAMKRMVEHFRGNEDECK